MTSRGRQAAAGMVPYRQRSDELEILIVHPGSPYSRGKENGAWSIPKGNPTEDPTLEDCARRELREETSVWARQELLWLGRIKQSKKIIFAWACDIGEQTPQLPSRVVQSEYPLHSGRFVEHLEIDRISLCSPETAKRLVHPAQSELIDRLVLALTKRRL